MDVYSMVTERIIKQLEQGYIPWRKPWANCLDGTFNRITRKPYSLLNQLLLTNEGEYATFKQWSTIGGKVKKGEKAEMIVFWKIQEEELVAEITSAAILHSLGMETNSTFTNSAAYIQNWLQVLKNDKRFIVSASGKAEKAVKYILNRQNNTITEKVNPIRFI